MMFDVVPFSSNLKKVLENFFAVADGLGRHLKETVLLLTQRSNNRFGKSGTVDILI